jgi:prefoldin subunit 5
MMGDNQEWYNNKELYEMFQNIESEMYKLRQEMAETRAIIRDYNGLRQKVEDTSGKINTLMWIVPVAIAGMGLLFTALNFILR